MLRYRLAALALKTFSAAPGGKRAYRALGNVLGNRRRRGPVPPRYIARAEANLRALEDRHAITDGMMLLELGTGWVHWEALYTRLFHDVRIALFDVWDNRQFGGFLHHAAGLRAHLATLRDRPAAALAQAQALLDRVLQTRDFAEAYAVLGFTYHLDREGSLAALPDAAFDLVISSDVLEHVPRDSVPTLAADLARVIKPGGRMAAQIVYVDHLTLYDRAVHPKNYLRYTDRQWRRWFENGMQYVNRLQPGDFSAAFTAAGFVMEAQDVLETCDSGQLPIAAPFRHYPPQELDIAVNRIIARKPAGPPERGQAEKVSIA